MFAQLIIRLFVKKVYDRNPNGYLVYHLRQYNDKGADWGTSGTHVSDTTREAGSTGLVLLSAGNILSLIEGSKFEIEKEFKEVKSHPGHHSIIKLYHDKIPCRFFDEYPLAFHVLIPGFLKELDDFKELGRKEYLEEFLQHNHRVSRILKNFTNHNSGR